MAFRPAPPPSYGYSSAIPTDIPAPPMEPTSATTAPSRKRPRTEPGQPTVGDDAFVADPEAGDSGADDDDDEDKPKDKKAGRRKIKIEFIQDKSRRHITFSKRKAGIMKKAYELSTLTGTQVLLLVVSETGLVYTFTTAKLQPLVTQPEGKNLIQACLNAPHGTLPSSMPVGTPLGRTSGAIPGPMNSNVPGGLSIGNKEEDAGDDKDDDGARGGASQDAKRRRRSSTSQSAPRPTSTQSPNHSPGQPMPPPLTIPGSGAPQQQGAQAALPMGSPSTQAQQAPGAQGYAPPHASPTTPYGHHAPAHAQGDPAGMYGGHMMAPPGGYYSQPQAPQGVQQHQQAHGHWGQPQQVQPANSHYGRR
ncbi:SRF-TF-domain-containing protein [Punctularia strigosozonata HHB-11173 SS5]|uniref:SRF-TF-domain-containing protein n=1 Tax=Punctularia strigosozonata (strain HHB-11173) TaxID=741275 RepID=UPI00044170F7|nr:SRF-TF-domain-containing protein [Punctularia strigosozonata HHB-11173 SS5]EIN12408.1 SRF-TF-domain-containing protein [Punctularia strigosozonata HHB-11173 SS5]